MSNSPETLNQNNDELLMEQVVTITPDEFEAGVIEILESEDLGKDFQSLLKVPIKLVEIV